MKVTVTPAHALTGAGQRLDASYHASAGVKALRTLRDWASATPTTAPSAATLLRESSPGYAARRLDRLADVCVPGGVFIPGRFKRIYVDDPVHGVPYLTGGDILRADPVSGAKFLSRRYTSNIDELALHPRMTLITCSGTIGNTVYVNRVFEGSVGSPDLIRVIADPDKIPPGYLYAFLSSPLGRALIEQKTYGAVIPHIEAHHVVDLPIPRLDAAMEERIHGLIEQAAQLRAEANDELALLVETLQCDIYGVPKNYTVRWQNEWSRDIGSISLGTTSPRLDAFHHVGHAVEFLHYVADGPILRDIADVTLPGKFKRMYVNSGGIPYLSGVDVYQIKVEPRLWLSPKQPELPELLINEAGVLLVQADGQRYGLLGRPVFADESMVGAAASNHLVRIRPNSAVDGGFVYVYLSTLIGRRELVRQSYGTSIPTIPVTAFQNLVIPGIDNAYAQEIGIGAVNALEKRTSANRMEDLVQRLLEVIVD